ncbi:MAG TPA: hypothetical protein PLI45_03840 [Candidatus Woesebacteria bacterium]|nr:hypothetical protein [Candidatus Woesebacteria bacterium]
MKKTIFVLLVVATLLIVGCSAVKADTGSDPFLLSDDSEYVGKVIFRTKVYGDTVTSDSLYWTAWDLFWPGDDCFVDGVNTVSISGLYYMSGYHWEVSDNTYCIVKD